jgi:hypothetical protein
MIATRHRLVEAKRRRAEIADRAVPKGGSVYLGSVRDRIEGGTLPCVCVAHPGGGVWRSEPIQSGDAADIVARVVADLLEAKLSGRG